MSSIERNIDSCKERHFYSRVNLLFGDKEADICKKFSINQEEEKKLISNDSSLGKIIIISGRSGAGKDTLIKDFLEYDKNSCKITSITTRQIRDGENDGIDYHFLEKKSFDLLFDKGLILDRVEYSQNLYGIPKNEFKKRIFFKNVIFNVNPTTAKLIKDLIPTAKTIIIKPISEEEQFKRLSKRNTENEQVILERIKNDNEMFSGFEKFYDFELISITGEFRQTLDNLKSIIINN